MKSRRSMLVGLFGLLSFSGQALADRPVAGSVTPERLKVPSGPSSVRGLADEPQIDPFNAQLNYEVPIELPNGLGGLTPSLALTYSGTLGNGPLGIGWSLSHAEIRRSMRLGRPKFDDSVDELEIAGIASGRLVAIGGDDYRVEGRGQTVRVKKAAGGGFDVDDGRGNHYRLGTSPTSRQEIDATHTLAWLVESETNQMGERIDYTYTHDGTTNQVYLSGVTWGPAYGVALEYEPRIDVSKSYRGGFAVVTAQRLKTITLTAFGVERRAYHLVYDPPPGDPTFPLARLSSVTSTGENGNGAWPSLSFKYAAPTPAPAPEAIAGVGAWRLNQNGTTLVDLDGDGAADLLMAQSGGHQYRLNQNGTFGAAVTIAGNTQPLSALQLQDVDGDARPELLQDSPDGWNVWKWSKTKWILQPGTWPGSKGLPLKQPTIARYADLNGDGLVDVMTWNGDGLNVFLGTRTGIAGSYPVGPIGGPPGVGVTPTTSGRFQDMNGDGLDDYTVVALDHLDVYIGRGDGTFEAAAVVMFPFDGTLADVNDIELGDLDRDGLVDLIKIETGQVRWFQGQADGTFTRTARTIANPETLSGAVTVAVADTNGNGSHDIVWSSANGMWRMELAGATTAGMLVEVQNGLGLDTTFDYQSSHALEVAAAQAQNAWTSFVPIAMPVPVQRTTALGVGETTRLVSYSVRNGFWDATEQRFGGFLTTIVTTYGATPAETSSVTTTYNKGTGTDRELRGTVTLERVRDGSGNLISDKSETWATMAVSGLPDTPLLRKAILKETTVAYDNGARNSDVTYGYDAFGRANHVADSGRTDLMGDEAVKDVTYADDDTTWVRDLVCEEKVSGTDGIVVRDVQHFFGDDQTENALCVVGKGWPRETRAWLATEKRWVTQTRTTYDGKGNPTSTTTGGVTHYISYDANGLFPIEEHVTAPSGGDLGWQAEWDNVLGVATSVTDPNGHTTHLHYDSLGRLTGNAIDGRLQHEVIEYDLSPPFPKTTVWQFDGALANVTAKPATWTPASSWRQTVVVRNGLGEARYQAERLSDSQWIISSYHEVDPSSRVVFAGRPVIASALELSARPAGIVGDTLAYDPLGRLITQTLPTGVTRTASYTSFERTVTEADLAPVHSVLDGQGRAILTERSLPDGTHEIVQAQYDPTGRLTQMTLNGGTVVRTFTYDTLGRLATSRDPDLGLRTMTWDDGNRLLTETNAAGQTIHYTYDSLGRLITQDTGSLYRYHYDTARAGAAGPLDNLVGQLAYVEEPSGGIDFGYDELGRTTFSRRRIDDRVSETTQRYAASGLLLGVSNGDGFALTYGYDAAGRLTSAGNLWTLVSQDASGLPADEMFGNGVEATYERDLLELAKHVTVKGPNHVPIYEVKADRNLATEITSIVDLDNVGLDHSATFGYDGFARLTSATAGSGTSSLTFGYSYDVLHNMTSRSGPAAVAAMYGTYRYGENGHAPRQLTSVAAPNGHVIHTFDYDAVGRQIAEDALRMTYDASDRLLRIDGVPGGSVAHVYGHDGARVKTVEPDGAVSYYFGDGTDERNGVREHDVSVGARVVARVAMTPSPGGASLAAGVFLEIGSWSLGLLALLLSWGVARPQLRRRARAAGLAAMTLAAACAGPSVGSRGEAIAGANVTYMHAGFSAGPEVFTDGAGNLLEERRHEPFGVPIDAFLPPTGHVSAPDLIDRDLNPLGKRTEVATGWSDHGARWMAPETARWLTPDPAVSAPDAAFMFAPWALHPYQYVEANPLTYWDPDGHQVAPVEQAAEGAGKQVAKRALERAAERWGTAEVLEGGAGEVAEEAAIGIGGSLLAGAAAFVGVTVWSRPTGGPNDSCQRGCGGPAPQATSQSNPNSPPSPAPDPARRYDDPKNRRMPNVVAAGLSGSSTYVRNGEALVYSSPNGPIAVWKIMNLVHAKLVEGVQPRWMVDPVNQFNVGVALNALEEQLKDVGAAGGVSTWPSALNPTPVPIATQIVYAKDGLPAFVINVTNEYGRNPDAPGN